MELLEILAAAVCAVVVGAYQKQDFARDSDFRSKPSRWFWWQWPVLVHCGLHTVLAFVFHFAAYKTIAEELAPTSSILALMEKFPPVTRPIASSVVFLALTRSSFWPALRDTNFFYFNIRQVSEGIRSIFRPWLLDRKSAQEADITTLAINQLNASPLNCDGQRIDAIKLVYQDIEDLVRSPNAKDHLMGKWSRITSDYAEKKTTDHQMIKLSLKYLVGFVGTWQELERMLNDAINIVTPD